MNLAASLLALCVSAVAWPTPHLGPPIWIELTVSDTRLTLSLSGEPKAMVQLLGEELDLVGPLDAAASNLADQAFSRLFEEQQPLVVAGVPCIGTLSEVVIPDDDEQQSGWLVATANYTVELERPARNVGIRWSRYEGAIWQGEQFIPLTIVSGRSVRGQALLYPEEPEYIWHPDPTDGPQASRLITGLSVQPVARLIEVPLLSIGFILMASILFVYSRRASRAGAVPRRLAFLALLASAASYQVGTLTISSPFERVVAMPSEDQALVIFESLHQNIYKAFMAETEDEIYDLLAVSVDDQLLDEIYGDIYESLILREQGGAVCSIEGVPEGTGRAQLPQEEDAPPIFRVDWSWQVNGIVSHWGHLHRRRNEYKGQYEVGYDGEAWKITGVEIQEHKRIDLPDPVIGLGGTQSE